jgi:predicted transcriptional regulator
MKAKINQRINEKPGIHLRKIERDLNCSTTTINYHVQDLPVRERKFNGYKRFYPERIEKSLEKPLAALNHETRGIILYQIKGGTGFSEIVEKTSYSKSTVSEHLKILEEDHLLKVGHRSSNLQMKPV